MMRGRTFVFWAAAWLLTAPLASRADGVEILDSHFFDRAETAPPDVKLSAGLALSTGDGYWDLGSDLQSLDMTLTELSLKLRAETRLFDDVRLGIMAPFVRRELDLAVPASEDIVGNGLGDIQIWLSYAWSAGKGWRLGPWVEWKIASGPDELAIVNNRDIASFAPSPVTGIPLGTGQNDLDAWLWADFDRGDLNGFVAAGFRYRTPADVFQAIDGEIPPQRRDASGNPIADSDFPNRVLVAARGQYTLDPADFGVWLSYWHAAEANRVNALDAGGYVTVRAPDGVSATISLLTPVYGKDYPDIPPFNFRERDPMLGIRLEATVAKTFQY